MKKLAFIGAGSHSDAVFYMQDRKNYKFVGYFDDKDQNEYNGYPILGTIEEVVVALDKGLVDNVFITIGDNIKRSEIFDLIKRNHYNKLINIVAPTATILNMNSLIGKGIFVGHNCFIGAEVVIKDNVIINTNSTIEHHTIIENHVNTTIGACIAGIVNIGEGVYLGASTTIIQCIEIAPWIKTGAGTVIVNDLDIENGLYVGLPARYIKKANQS